MLLQQVYDHLGRPFECDWSKCDSSDSSDPLFCCWTLWRATGALTALPYCCETFRRATGVVIALPLPFRSFFATTTFSASLTSKLSLNVTVLVPVLLRANEVACLPSTWWDMEYFHTHSTELARDGLLEGAVPLWSYYWAFYRAQNVWMHFIREFHCHCWRFL